MEYNLHPMYIVSVISSYFHRNKNVAKEENTNLKGIEAAKKNSKGTEEHKTLWPEISHL